MSAQAQQVTPSNVTPIKVLADKEELPLQSVSPLDLPTTTFESTIKRRTANKQLLEKWIQDNFVENIDFGSIPTKRGLSKPALFKPGAEKVASLLNLVATYPALAEYEKAALNNQKLEQIIIRCELTCNNQLIATGIGARSLKQDFNDFNKSLKICCKSGLIDGILKLGLSHCFTVDYGDPNDDTVIAPPPTVSVTPPELISDSHYKMILGLIESHSVSKPRFIAWLTKFSAQNGYDNVTKLKETPDGLVEQIIEKIPSFSNTI
jgi:hypothetical protein